MNPYKDISNQIKQCLNLKHSPVGISFSADKPADVSSFNGTVAAGCVFWQEATHSIFSTSTQDHELCAIGVHTHNMTDSSEQHTGELQDALAAMIGLDYVREDEIAQIPVLEKKTKHIVYGPLEQLSRQPEIVLIFAHSQQGLILSEAVSRVDGNIPLAMGRPACAVIPQVMNQGVAAMSLGCCGARAYLDQLSDDLSLWALPGNKINDYLQELDILTRANRTLSVFHERRKEDVLAGKKPLIKESLARLS